jgi:hypothetical protein
MYTVGQHDGTLLQSGSPAEAGDTLQVLQWAATGHSVLGTAQAPQALQAKAYALSFCTPLGHTAHGATLQTCCTRICLIAS